MAKFNLNSVKLNHYSEKELKFQNKRYTQKSHPDIKPIGFWLTFDDQWFNWCIDAGYEIQKLRFCTEFKIKNSKNLVILDSPKACLQFQEDYGTAGFLGNNPYNKLINWKIVQDDGYDGLVFTNLIYKNRTVETPICYLWDFYDVESVCVWDTSIIKPVETYEVVLTDEEKRRIGSWGLDDNDDKW